MMLLKEQERDRAREKEREREKWGDSHLHIAAGTKLGILFLLHPDMPVELQGFLPPCTARGRYSHFTENSLPRHIKFM